MTGALLSAVLLALAYPPLSVPLLPFLALAPFAVAVDRTPADRPRRAALLGGVLGAVHFALVLHWMPVALGRSDLWLVPLYGVVVGLLALLLAAAAWALHHLRHRAGLPMALALPVVWTGAEWLRSAAPGPLAFPWLGLGTALASVPSWAGVAEWVGARGVTFWLAAVSGLLADAWRARGAGRRAWALRLAAAVAVAAVPAAWGVRRAATLPTRTLATVTLVQPDVPAGGSVDERLSRTLTALQAATPQVTPGSAMVLLPEMLVPVPLRDPRALPLIKALVGLSRQGRAPVMFGAPGVVVDEAGDTAVRNSVMVATPSGLAPMRFDKHRLVPGVEATSLLRLGWPGTPPAGYQAGDTWPLLKTGDGLWGVLVCFESAFPDVARRLRRDGADAVVSVTNDGWFGGEAAWARTGALWQHPAHLVMRAVETRAGMVRVATTGRSMVVDPTGRVRSATPFFRPAVVRAEVRTSDVLTGYALWGDVVGPLSAVAAALLLLWGEVRERRRRWAREGVPERYRRWWWGTGHGPAARG